MIDLSDIYLDLLKGEETSSFKIATPPHPLCINSAQSLNKLSALQEENDNLFSTQDREIISILEALQKNNEMAVGNAC